MATKKAAKKASKKAAKKAGGKKKPMRYDEGGGYKAAAPAKPKTKK
jgi:hypothetical protein